MQEFYLKEHLSIPGISSASGIEFSEGQIFIISDNSNYLYNYQIYNEELNRQVLLKRPQMDHIEKPQKLDLEAMVLYDDKIYTFGSGSTKAREKGFSISKNDGQIIELDLKNLYSGMKNSANINSSDFSIEGVAVYENSWLFLNRGNGPGGRNVILKVDGDDLVNDFIVSSFEISLPEVDGSFFGFSGGCVLNDSLYFIATAEEGLSTYDDGVIAGTILGVLNLKTMEIDYYQRISKDQKFEGISLFEIQPQKISFILCEDSDGSSEVTTIYRLDLKLS